MSKVQGPWSFVYWQVTIIKLLSFDERGFFSTGSVVQKRMVSKQTKELALTRHAKTKSQTNCENLQRNF